MANSSVTIHLRIDQSAGDWQYIVNEDDGGSVTTLHQITLDANNLDILVTAGIGPTGLSPATSLDVEFDSLGNIVSVLIGATPGAVQNGILILISGSINQSVCLSPLGFAHDGACV